MVWNYRGYGLSDGQPDPHNIRSDGERLVKYMREVLGLKGKIGVYGRSLGGVVTTHLADKVDMLFVDRTFCSFDVLANRKFYSSYADVLFKLGSGGWVLNNDTNIISKGIITCHKVMMTEKVDEVIEVHSSLMAGVARDALGLKNKKPGNFYLCPN